MALGGSTNTVLHLPAIASEAGISFPLKKINEISRRTPYLSNSVLPAYIIFRTRPGGRIPR